MNLIIKIIILLFTVTSVYSKPTTQSSLGINLSTQTGVKNLGTLTLSTVFREFVLYPNRLLLVGGPDMINVTFYKGHEFVSLGGRGGVGYTFFQSNNLTKKQQISGSFAFLTGLGSFLGLDSLSKEALSDWKLLGYKKSFYGNISLEMYWNFAFGKKYGINITSALEYDYMANGIKLNFGIGLLI